MEKSWSPRRWGTANSKSPHISAAEPGAPCSCSPNPIWGHPWICRFGKASQCSLSLLQLWEDAAMNFKFLKMTALLNCQSCCWGMAALNALEGCGLWEWKFWFCLFVLSFSAAVPSLCLLLRTVWEAGALQTLHLYPVLVSHNQAWQSSIVLTAEKYQAWWTFALQEQAVWGAVCEGWLQASFKFPSIII